MTHGLIVMMLLVGCDRGEGDRAPVLAALFPDGCPATACKVGAPIADASSFAAAVAGALPGTADWPWVSDFTTGCLAASADHAIVGTLTVRGADITPPETCASPDACEPVGFDVSGAPAGVTCLEPTYFWDFASCAVITITDATIRLRPLRRDLHPGGSNAPLVEVLAPCEAPCGEGELTCETAHTCWAAERDHCAYCLGGTNEACGCWDGDAPAADGAPCQIAVSGDIIVGGTCRAGACDIAD